MKQIILVVALALLLVSVSRGNIERVEQTLGFSKKCEYHIDQIAESITEKYYVAAYIHSVLALDVCDAYTEDEVEALSKVKGVRNKLMEEY